MAKEPTTASEIFININMTDSRGQSVFEKCYELPWLTSGPVDQDWLEKLRKSKKCPPPHGALLQQK